MKRPPNIPIILWWATLVVYPFMCTWYFIYSRCTKAGREEKRKWKALEQATKDGTLRKEFLANSRPIELPPDYGTWLLLQDEPTKGRELLREEAARNAKT